MDNLESLMIFLFIGLVAGWLAGLLVRGRGFGMLSDILVGVIGAEFGGWIFSRLGLSVYGFTGAVFMALVGAVALLTLIKLVVKASSGSVRTIALLAFLLAGSSSAFAATTVTVDDKPQTVVVTEVPVVNVVPVAAQQVVITQVNPQEDFEGEIERIDRATRTIDVIDTEQKTRQVLVTQEAIDTYRTGDFVRIHSIPNVREVTFIREESNRDLEGRIINVDNSQATLTVRDGQGRDRRVKLKQGMISNYKVDDYVRIHLMADLKEAKMIRTIK